MSGPGDVCRPRRYDLGFPGAEAGALPGGWDAGVTGAKEGEAPKWEAIRDEDHNVLAQSGAGGDRGDFPVCLKQESAFKDGTVTVRMKPITVWFRLDVSGGEKTCCIAGLKTVARFLGH